MALNFGILQPANISGQLQAGQEAAMRNQLAQQQLAAGQQQMETGRMQQEKAGLEMQQFKRRQSALDKFLSDVKIIFFDERLSSFAAEELLESGEAKNNKRKGLVDQIAASIILQGAIDLCHFQLLK